MLNKRKDKTQDTRRSAERLQFVVNIEKRLSKSVDKVVARNEKLETNKGCVFPTEWDWDQYMDKSEDHCQNLSQLFLGLDEWTKNFTTDCKRPAKALKFHQRLARKFSNVLTRINKKIACPLN